MVCVQGMARNKEGLCSPQLAVLAPTYWESTTGQDVRLKCGDGWTRDEQGVCQLQLPSIPAVPKDAQTKAGPQKACPSDASDKWDEDYISRTKLPTTTPMVYVDSKAITGGDGSKAKPYMSLAIAIQRAVAGSVILLAPGDYSWGGLASRNVHIVGRCTEGVRLLAQPGRSAHGIRAVNVTIALEGLSVLGQGNAGSTAAGLFFRNSTVTLRHLRVSQTQNAGIFVEGGAGLIEHVTVEGTQTGEVASGIGIALFQLTGNAAVRFSSVSGSSQAGIFVDSPKKVELQFNRVENNNRGISSGSVHVVGASLPVLIQNNYIANNAYTGVAVVNSSDVRIEGNVVLGSGTLSKDAPGVSCSKTKNVVVKENQVLNSASLAFLMNAVESLEVVNNLFQDNGLKSASGGGYVSQSFSSLKVVGNRFRKNQGQSLFVGTQGGGQVLVERNEFVGGDSSGTAISMQQTGVQTLEDVVIRHNHIRQFGEAGLVMKHAKRLTVSWNVIEAVSLREPSTHGVFVEDVRGLYRLDGNHIKNHKGSGFWADRVSQLQASGNWVESNAWASQKPPETLFYAFAMLEATQDVAVTFNVFRNSPGHGLVVGNTYANVAIASNRIEANVSLGPRYTALGITGCYADCWVKQNLIANNGRGGVFSVSANGHFSDNVWAHNRFVGLVVRASSGKVTLEREQFEHNANSHLRLENNTSQLRVLQSGFYQAEPSPGYVDDGVPPSQGVGVWAGASGLVRWAFAPSDYNCSPTKRGLVAPLAGGWTMRPVRVPQKLDPCQGWTQRTQNERLQQGKCQRCREQGKACRWIWKDSVATPNQGFWQPQADVQCVDKSEPHNCEGAPSFDGVSPRPVESVLIAYGLCGTLGSSVVDACKNFPCPDGSYCLRQLVEEGGQQRVVPFCAPWGRTAAYCYSMSCANGSPCSEGSPCGDGSSCQPRELSCPQGQLCLYSQPTREPDDSLPSRLDLQGSVFWRNSGPDVLMDMAGRVVLENNDYLCEKKGSTCRAKIAFRNCKVSSENPGCKTQEGSATSSSLGHETFELPQGATLIWQNPSPYDSPYDSKLEGNDIQRRRLGKPLLFLPDQCNVVSSQ